MKSAEEWRNECLGAEHVMPDFIEAVQVDALAYAAQCVHDMSRGTKSEQRAIAIDEARDLILEEMRSLQRRMK